MTKLGTIYREFERVIKRLFYHFYDKVSLTSPPNFNYILTYLGWVDLGVCFLFLLTSILYQTNGDVIYLFAQSEAL